MAAAEAARRKCRGRGAPGAGRSWGPPGLGGGGGGGRGRYRADPPEPLNPCSEPPRDAVLGAGRGNRAGRDEAVMAAGPWG